jgi:predicted nuclease of restriction endonuclease-like (RecB) superfamily
MPELPTTPPTETAATQSYEEFLEDIKGRIRSAQARAARAINAELIEVYWQIGREILQRQAGEGDRRGRGGPKIVERLSADLQAAFPGVRGFSVSSLRYMRAFAAAWPEREMLQSGTGALPWAHIMLLLDKLSDRTTRDWYASRATSWSKAELAHHIANRLHEREGAAITNFEQALQDGDAEAVQRITRDPVVLDFVQLADGAKERDLEAALLEDIERFMLALGEGFYFAGRQKSLEIGGEEFILDLLFFHHPTRRFVVIDLKLGPFKAEFVGKMNLYVNAVDGASRMRWRDCGAWSSRLPSSPPAERTSWRRTIDKYSDSERSKSRPEGRANVARGVSPDRPAPGSGLRSARGRSSLPPPSPRCPPSPWSDRTLP